MPVNTNLHIYKNSCDSSKDRLDTKILSQFSKLPDKNFCWSFLSPKKLLINKKGKGKKESKRERLKQIRKNRSKFWLLRMSEKQKSCLITSD